MSSIHSGLERIGGLAVEMIQADDEYRRVVIDEFERGVRRECIVSQVDACWREVIDARFKLEREVRGYLMEVR
jgi:hypothetical protein